MIDKALVQKFKAIVGEERRHLPGTGQVNQALALRSQKIIL